MTNALRQHEKSMAAAAKVPVSVGSKIPIKKDLQYMPTSLPQQAFLDMMDPQVKSAPSLASSSEGSISDGEMESPEFMIARQGAPVPKARRSPSLLDTVYEHDESSHNHPGHMTPETYGLPSPRLKPDDFSEPKPPMSIMKDTENFPPSTKTPIQEPKLSEVKEINNILPLTTSPLGQNQVQDRGNAKEVEVPPLHIGTQASRKSLAPIQNKEPPKSETTTIDVIGEPPSASKEVTEPEIQAMTPSVEREGTIPPPSTPSAGSIKSVGLIPRGLEVENPTGLPTDLQAHLPDEIDPLNLETIADEPTLLDSENITEPVANMPSNGQNSPEGQDADTKIDSTVLPGDVQSDEPQIRGNTEEHENAVNPAEDFVAIQDSAPSTVLLPATRVSAELQVSGSSNVTAADPSAPTSDTSHSGKLKQDADQPTGSNS